MVMAPSALSSSGGRGLRLHGHGQWLSPGGEAYGKRELTHPTRVITSTVRCTGGAYPRCPVKTSGPVPKERIFDVAAALDGITVEAPVRLGQVVVKDVCGTGADFVSTRALPQTDEAAGGA